MAILPFRRKKTEEHSDLNQLIDLIQKGDSRLRNKLLEDYIPFVAKCASQTTGRYVEPGVDDEFSVALSAFNEAIDRYDIQKGASFLGFAETVIKRRLIDFYRSQSVRNKDVPFSDFDMDDEEDHVVNYVEVQRSLDLHQQSIEIETRQDEIIRFTEWLAEFDISLDELVELSPKHADARLNAMEVARVIAGDSELRNYLMDKKALPLKLLSSRVSVSRKTVERQRKYIIAITLILIGEFEMLKGYIQ
ncbi:RNA polymerase sigma factor SigI [Effusibacillus lacus]|uniref:RNA polymerase sigma factor SigI n=1 Tax=Effusibacillus lacus TaxID=1348429 RepID=A0A292YRC9_9BACL|nr:RNA polymerase sigma factor SigI [Effusibacillus lacus]TCS68961.1 RNA polymerase sigma factor [Effusibacillus lacus]GAX91471.1 RNA polymerase subunit sigma [Effusibacillus lacus]